MPHPAHAGAALAWRSRGVFRKVLLLALGWRFRRIVRGLWRPGEVGAPRFKCRDPFFPRRETPEQRQDQRALLGVVRLGKVGWPGRLEGGIDPAVFVSGRKWRGNLDAVVRLTDRKSIAYRNPR